MSTYAGDDLCQAARDGDLARVEALLAEGVDVDADNADGNTALIQSTSHLDCLKALLSAGADVDAQGRKGMTALMVAASNGNLDAVERLLEAGADEGLEDEAGRTYENHAEGEVREWLQQEAREEDVERLDQTLPEGNEETRKGRF